MIDMVRKAGIFGGFNWYTLIRIEWAFFSSAIKETLISKKDQNSHKKKDQNSKIKNKANSYQINYVHGVHVTHCSDIYLHNINFSCISSDGLLV